ncbi:MAG: T9SS type A sorting domain-containing protein [Bacteroidia bacterium]
MKQLLLLCLALSLTLGTSAQWGAGGPDLFGYTWKDSNEPGGPSYAWFDITTIGTQVTGLSDDNVVGPFGWIDGFQFYWYYPSQVWIGSNGYLTFNGFNIASPFPTIPNTAAPNDFIAPLLSDLNFDGAGNPGQCYYYSNADSIVVSFINVPYWQNSIPAYTGSNTFQIILNRADKSITYNYQSLSGLTMNNDITIGIENITGQLGLQHSKNMYPSGNYTVKFEYPPNVTYQAVDGGVNWNMAEGNGGVFVKQGEPTMLVTNIKNFGNQNLPIINVSSSVSRPGTTTLSNTASVANLAAGFDTLINLNNPLTPVISGIYDMNTTISGITGDLVPANNSLRTKIIAVDTTQVSMILDYSDGLPDGGGLSWSGGSGGIGYYFKPPFSPCRIDAYRMYITADATNQGCHLKIYADDGPGGTPGTLLDSTFAGSGSFGLNSYSTLPLSSPVTITTGGFYLLWEMPGGSSITLARDLTPPISYRAYEVLGGSWASYRSRFTEDFLLSVETSRPQLQDMSTVSIMNINANDVFTSPVAPQVRIANGGDLPNQAMTVRYQFGSGTIVAENIFANVLNPGDSLSYTFNTGLSASTTTTADLCVWVQMQGDMNASNDTICIPITYEVNTTQVTENLLQALKLYPNPANDHLFLQLPEGLYQLQLSIQDIRGRSILQQSFNPEGNRILEIPINQLQAGTYMLRLYSNEDIRQFKFIKH